MQKLRSGVREKMPAASQPAGEQLSHIEVTHHLSDGSSMMDRVEPGKMIEHLADCPHCGGGQ